MIKVALAGGRFLNEEAVTDTFLNDLTERTFADLFRVFTPQLVAFFRTRGCAGAAEDLAQEVMLTVYLKAAQVRDRSLFRAWVFRIARNTISRHFGTQARCWDTVNLEDVPERLVTSSGKGGGSTAFEFNHWMSFLDVRESEALTLRFIEEWEYHEIAAAQGIPIGTVQWRVFSAKRKLAPLLKKIEHAECDSLRKAA
jgi:RNA polymerase sigma-70 factor (ECF subfamily)